MRKDHCLRWAKALINGKHEKLTGDMSNAKSVRDVPTAMCCLGVANETFKVEGYKKDRLRGTALLLSENDIFKSENPEIFGKHATYINDGMDFTHEEIGMLLLFAIESGEYKNI